MPLIRYRTGDLAAFRVDLCSCGTVLRTLDAVRGQIEDQIQLDSREVLTVGDLGEAFSAVMM